MIRDGRRERGEGNYADGSTMTRAHNRSRQIPRFLSSGYTHIQEFPYTQPDWQMQVQKYVRTISFLALASQLTVLMEDSHGLTRTKEEVTLNQLNLSFRPYS